jgi:GTPase SAR1 family protein
MPRVEQETFAPLIKLAVVGDNGVGKSSILCRFRSGSVSQMTEMDRVPEQKGCCVQYHARQMHEFVNPTAFKQRARASAFLGLKLMQYSAKQHKNAWLSTKPTAMHGNQVSSSVSVKNGTNASASEPTQNTANTISTIVILRQVNSFSSWLSSKLSDVAMRLVTLALLRTIC